MESIRNIRREIECVRSQVDQLDEYVRGMRAVLYTLEEKLFDVEDEIINQSINESRRDLCIA